MKKLLITSLAYFLTIVRWLILFTILLLIIAFVSRYASNIERYPTLVKVIQFEKKLSTPVTEQIKMAMPYKFKGVDYSQGILFVLLLVLAHIAASFREKLELLGFRMKEEAKYQRLRKLVGTNVSKEKLSEIDSKFKALNTTKPNDRKKILEEFAHLKSKLDSMGQQLAFLSIDVVDSTGMKRDEDKHLAEYDFDRYNQCVYDALFENGVIKYTSTPDGIMSCFRTVDAAVNAAVCLLEKLVHFNTNEKKIKRDFQIRCGINAGFVYIDDETPLEHISDRTLDIAGHMQKYAKPNGINIAASAIEPLKNRSGFNETTDVIDEQRVYEWKTEKML